MQYCNFVCTTNYTHVRNEVGGVQVLLFPTSKHDTNQQSIILTLCIIAIYVIFYLDLNVIFIVYYVAHCVMIPNYKFFKNNILILKQFLDSLLL